jgi:hypothetical protein
MILIFNLNVNAAVQNPPPDKDYEWYWLASNNKYSKYFAPISIRVLKQTTNEAGQEIPTEIEAWTKTTYTVTGATETIKNYGISNILPDPQILSYSLALLKINPQTRTVQYAREDFYDAKGKILWSKTEGRVKEINSQAFDEDFYAAIVDEVFRQGEVARKKAEDRWIELWNFTNADGVTTTVTADTTTFQLKGKNLIFWEWQEEKTADKKIVEIRFVKKSVNLNQGTERIVRGEIWTSSNKRWKEIEDDYGGKYRMIKKADPDYKGLVRLRAFAKGYSTWVKRYAIS